MDVQNILSTIDLAELRNHIIQTSIVAWKNYITESSLDRWLKNFDGAALGNAVVEQTIAAWLLLNFTYYTDTEVRELCKIIYRKFIHRKLQEEYYQRSSEDVQTKIQRILTRTIFLPLGNPSESGALILYNFRTANALPKRVFNQPIDWSTKLSDGNIDDIVLIDDVTLSGSQAIDYVGRLPVNNIQTTLMTFFATPIAINNGLYFAYEEDVVEREYTPLSEYFTSAVSRDVVLVCFLGFERLISKYIHERKEHSDVIAINGFPAYYPKLKDISLAHNYELISTIGLNCVRYAQANNPFSAYNTLVEIKDSNTDKLLDICVLGSKPMALGACMFALRNPQIVKVSYPFPKASRVHTSIEVSNLWLYTITL